MLFLVTDFVVKIYIIFKLYIALSSNIVGPNN